MYMSNLMKCNHLLLLPLSLSLSHTLFCFLIENVYYSNFMLDEFSYFNLLWWSDSDKSSSVQWNEISVMSKRRHRDDNLLTTFFSSNAHNILYTAKIYILYFSHSHTVEGVFSISIQAFHTVLSSLENITYVFVINFIIWFENCYFLRC